MELSFEQQCLEPQVNESPALAWLVGLINGETPKLADAPVSVKHTPWADGSE